MINTSSRCRFTLALLVLAVVAVTIPVAHAQTFSVLYDFGTNSGDPLNPQWSGIIAQGRDGNLYSTTYSGGASDMGAMFKITPSGTLTVPYSFDSTDKFPVSGLTLGTDGNFYGATELGGSSSYGTVFKITPSGTVTVLYNFTGIDESETRSPPIQGKDGNFYGTTQGYLSGFGTVYKITPSGKLTTLYSFDGIHGEYPQAPLVQGTDGNFYGTTGSGGTAGSGVVFKITASGKLTVLYNFDGTHGAGPAAPLVQGTDGNFYGTTQAGGNSYGVVFKITPSGKLTVLHSMTGVLDGYAPFAGLVQATDGNFYGTTIMGGTASSGNIFRITPTGGYSVLYNFDGSTTGGFPYVTLVQHTNGILYGDTDSGGLTYHGVFYSLNVGLKPFVSLVSASGKEGAKVGILGQGFSSSSVVKFGGTQATTILRTGTTFITATVPAGALTGSVTVTTGMTTLTSRQTFKVLPTVTSFSPTSGPVGTPVTITGTELTQTSKVTFGGVKATTVTVNSDSQVTADVPTGATTGKIAVTTKGGSATSATSFTVN